MKQMEVTILGQSYLLACPEGGEAALQAAVTLVHQEMSAIRDAGKVKARERMAVLAALNIAFRLGDAASAQAQADAEPNAGAAFPLAPSDAAEEPLIDQLIAKLDATLGDDGRLL